MTLKQIKPGKWYETKQGIGVCKHAGGTHPPSIQMEIHFPFPRGTVYVSPRDVIREVDPPKPKDTQSAS